MARHVKWHDSSQRTRVLDAPGLPASFFAHALLAALFLVLRPGVHPFPPVEEAVAIEMVDEPPVRPSPVPNSVEAMPTPLESAPAAPDFHAPIIAEQILTLALLTGPYGRKMQSELDGMHGDTRLEQLCNIEAMAQIGKVYPTLRAAKVVAYAAGPVRAGPEVLEAPRGAVETAEGWYRLAYRCVLTPDRRNVKGFDLVIGKTIPRSLWERYNLPAPGQKRMD
jgi:Domain of Unknown Function (DUF930)